MQFPNILSSGRVQGELLRLLHFLLFKIYETVWLKKGFQVVLVVKNLPANAGNIRDTS